MKYSAAIFLVFFALHASAAKPVVHAAVGSAPAPRGGTFYLNLTAEPENLNPINHSELVTSIIGQYVIEPLLQVNPDTYELVPGLADKFEVSKDGLTFTFHLRKGALFSDGTPITIDDVRFTFECINDPAFKAVHRRSYLEDIARIETPEPETIRFVMKKKYYKNLEVLGQFFKIVPKHVYGDPKKSNNRTMIGSGPYKIEAYNQGKDVQLVRNDNWWGYKTPTPETANQGKFDKIVYRFTKDLTLQMELLKKGQLDMLDWLQPEQFVQMADGEPFGTTIIKHKEENMDPNNKIFGFIGWNLKNPLFKDRDVRIALSELMNRKLMNEKFRFGLSDIAAGPNWFRNSETVDSSVKPLPFDPKNAGRLLKKAGWVDKEKTGILQKEIDGKPVEFRFTLLLARRELEKYFTMYKEELKKAGIEMNIQIVEWNVFVKLFQEQKFEALTMSWSPGSIEFDLKQIFHSSSSAMGGSNFISYSNPKVDKLIDDAREEMDTKKRRGLWKKAYKLIAEDAPYTFTFSTRYDLYLVWKHIGMTKGTLKFDRGQYWWWRAAP